jgi:PilZ domain
MAALIPNLDLASSRGTSSTNIERPRRFPVETAILYRVMGGGPWRTGITKNISVSGILFLAEEVEEPSTRIEMRLALPTDVSHGRRAELICHGRVVRAEQSNDGESLPALASSISDYRFVRP